jgi:hypothetical protein
MISPATAQKLLSDERNTSRDYAIKNLLMRLERWARAWPRMGDYEIPDHRIVFVTEVDDGPGKDVDDAIRSTPELWADALPDDVVIVPRKSLESAGLSRYVIEILSSMGGAIVETHAAKHRQMLLDEADDRKQRAKK